MAADPAPLSAIEGRVEVLDERQDISGWAIDRADPAATLIVELWADTLFLASTRTGSVRPDVAAALGVDCRPGFRFDADALAAVRIAAADGLTGALSVKVSGRGESLPSGAPYRTLQMVRRDDCGSTQDLGEALLARLSDHVRAAAGTDAFQRPVQGQGVGFVEGIWMDPASVTWLVGWMIEDAVLDRPIVIVDDAVHPAGMACVLAARGDLAPGSKAFVAVVSTPWRAIAELPPTFVFADDSGRYLPSLPSNVLMTRQQITPIIRQTLSGAEGGERDAIRTLFHDTSAWSVDQEEVDRVQVDEIAILPGFGAFVNGWALSPSKRAERLTLRAGGDIMRADARSQFRFHRDDVLTLYPNVEEASVTAGFVATFRGAFDHSSRGDMTLKVTWDDGTSTNAAIAPVARRVLGVTTPIEAALRFYPAVEAEEFFDDFAHHAAWNLRARAQQVTGYAVNRSAAVLLLGAPDNQADLFLLIERTLRHADRLPPEWGIAILGRPGLLRPLLVSLFADLKAALARPCSLLFTHDLAPTTDAVAAVAAMLGADRIGWVAPQATLTADGWAAIGDARGPFTLLGEDVPFSESAGVAADAFVADVCEWRRLADAATPRIGGVWPDIDGGAACVSQATLSLGQRDPSALATAINRTIERHHG